MRSNMAVGVVCGAVDGGGAGDAVAEEEDVAAAGHHPGFVTPSNTAYVPSIYQ